MKTNWLHGDTPSAAIFNEYCTLLTTAHNVLGDNGGWSIAQERISEGVYTLLHTWRYLHFVSVGKLMDLAETPESEIDINEDETGQGVIDLDEIDWLTYGELYKVTGVTVCIEDWSP